MANLLDGFDWTTPFIADACVQLSLPVRVGPYGLKPNIAGAKAAQIWSDHPAVIGKVVDLWLPNRVIQREPMHQQ